MSDLANLGDVLSALTAILLAAATNFSTYVVFAALLVSYVIIRLVRDTDKAWLRVVAVMIVVAVLGSGGYALWHTYGVVQEAVAEDAAEAASGQVDAPLRLVVRGTPADNVRVRRALLRAVAWDDLPATVAEVAFGESLTDWTEASHDVDPQDARQLLAEAGYPYDNVATPRRLPIQLRLADAATARVVLAVEMLATQWSAIGTTSIVRGSGGTAAASITVDVLPQR